MFENLEFMDYKKYVALRSVEILRVRFCNVFCGCETRSVKLREDHELE